MYNCTRATHTRAPAGTMPSWCPICACPAHTPSRVRNFFAAMASSRQSACTHAGSASSAQPWNVKGQRQSLNSPFFRFPNSPPCLPFRKATGSARAAMSGCDAAVLLISRACLSQCSWPNSILLFFVTLSLCHHHPPLPALPPSHPGRQSRIRGEPQRCRLQRHVPRRRILQIRPPCVAYCEPPPFHRCPAPAQPPLPSAPSNSTAQSATSTSFRNEKSARFSALRSASSPNGVMRSTTSSRCAHSFNTAATRASFHYRGPPALCPPPPLPLRCSCPD